MAAPSPDSEPTRARRLGLFGGSFDPVHLGHLHAARSAREAFSLDRVVFVPAARPPHKPGRVLASGADRVRMLELALEGESDFDISDLELAREGPSYTMDTVRELRSAVGESEAAELYMILGSDNLRGLEKWSRVEELLREVVPIVIFRAGASKDALDELRGDLSEEILERLRNGFLDLPPVEASSTAVRTALGGGEEPSIELPPSVGEYIRSRGLYAPA